MDDYTATWLAAEAVRETCPPGLLLAEVKDRINELQAQPAFMRMRACSLAQMGHLMDTVRVLEKRCDDIVCESVIWFAKAGEA